MGEKRKKRDKQPGYGKILDAWAPPEKAGEPVGCVATSFTFSPVFFEEECLGRFLGMETDPVEDGPLYLVEREEKLAQLVCAAALVDQHHSRGSRSLRWDLLPARVRTGVLHAKVSILHWVGWVRVIVASANLTKDGYRRNQEVFGVLDYRPNGDAPLSCLQQITDFLRESARYTLAEPGSRSPALNRWNRFLDRIQAGAEGWGNGEGRGKDEKAIVSTVLVGPGRQGALDSLLEAWPAGSPPVIAEVVSPFFDPSDGRNEPAEELWERLRKRGEAVLRFHITGEDVTGEGKVLLHAPESLKKAQPRGRPGVCTEFCRISLPADRPLHAKGIWLEDDRYAVYMIGSSNFTRAGLGTAQTGNAETGSPTTQRGNLEANLVYSVDKRRSPNTYKALRNSLLTGSRIDTDSGVIWKPKLDTGEDSAAEAPVLPHAFREAVFSCTDGRKGSVALHIEGDPPREWVMLGEEDETLLFSEQAWLAEGRPAEAKLDWGSGRPPAGFWIRWRDSVGLAWWPVNVATPESLPPPDELKDLPVDVLVDILTSARPLHQALRKYLRRSGTDGGVEISYVTAIDPHKRVDTSQFLLQRTRRVSWGLTALRERIERPAISRECLNFRLKGPVGPLAMARAVTKEARTAEEKAFLLSELALELSRAKYQQAEGCLPPEEVEAEVRRILGELRNMLPLDQLRQEAKLASYVEEVFRTVMT